MSRSFDGTGYFNEDVFIRAEDAAFRQATMISVVSQVIKDSLVARGVEAFIDNNTGYLVYASDAGGLAVVKK